MARFSVIGVALVLFGCASSNPKDRLSDHHYNYRQPGQRYSKVFVDVEDDTIKIIPTGKNPPVQTKRETNQFFMRPSFDVDILVTVFKYRPSSLKFPRQLNTDFNGNLYFGYRIDRFCVQHKKTPAGTSRQIKHMALTAGMFGGLGSVAITPWTTNYRTTDEYNGFALTRGLVLMFNVNNNTVGLAVGWDYITDRDKDIWIYQNKPWYGLTFSINLN